ncbi:glycosyltransferase family 39 protein [Actinomadura scrupuli]|uniref:glycosyltransferase family 39 protein n=1 Tax=Actinomadura scrupuli TaxID=559629 RepID=UPI003D956144
MTTPTTALTPRRTDPARPTEPGVLTARPWLVPVIPLVAALAITLWGIGSPSLWRDEAVTAEVARFSLHDTFRTLANVDAVHTVHYLLAHVMVSLFGGSELALRLPSALGSVAAATGTALLGRRLAGPRTGLTAGLIVAASPTISMWAEEARSYTIVTALAVWATYLLVRAVDAPTRSAFARYGAAIAVLGLVHLFALLLIPVHALALWRTADRTITRRWLAALTAATAAITPLALITIPQKDQLDWIAPPTLRDLTALASSFAGSSLLIIPITALAALGLTRRPAPSTSRIDLRILATAWAILPPAILLAVSLIHPYYVFRYVLLCIPAVALLAAAGLSRLPLKLLAPTATALALISVPAHLAVREPTSRMDDLRQAATILRDHQRPGDSIVFQRGSFRRTVAAYPDAYARLTDLSQAQTPAQAANLNGTDITIAQFEQRLAHTDRVWFLSNYVVPGKRGQDSALSRAKVPLIQHSPHFHLLHTWRYHGGTLTLYQHIS